MDEDLSRKYTNKLNNYARIKKTVFSPILEKSVLEITTRHMVGSYVMSAFVCKIPDEDYVSIDKISFKKEIEKILNTILCEDDRLMIDEILIGTIDKILHSDHRYDLFISHANCDKPYVNKLVTELKKVTDDIWYDSQCISIGDDQEKKIEEGLKKSEFGVIVISKDFFDREWTNRELNVLISKQFYSNKKVILPILLDVTVKEYSSKYPNLKNIFALEAKSDASNISDIVYAIAKELLKRFKGVL